MSWPGGREIDDRVHLSRGSGVPPGAAPLKKKGLGPPSGHRGPLPEAGWAWDRLLFKQPGGGRFKRREESLLFERRLIARPGRAAAVTTSSLPLVEDRFAPQKAHSAQPQLTLIAFEIRP